MMEASNYWLVWLIYLLAAAAFLAVFWRFTRFKQATWLSYSLRAIVIAIILTPWYANPQGGVLAPALIVVLLDAITIGGSEAARATVPLVLAIILALLVATVMFVINKRRNQHSVKKQIDKVSD